MSSPSTETICCLFERGGEHPISPIDYEGGVSFSVVICTDNRLDCLKRAISSLRYQTYRNFELCVIAGPTEDGTHAFLRDLGGQLKIADCPERNLSRSRNMGISLAAGNVVAFIDDDAVPEAEWLTQLARSYDDPRVGAVGGVVHDHIGIDYQARFVSVDRLGRPREETRPTPELNFPGSLQFPHLLGTNCSFRRSALLEIGGFDEVYEYFLDETDVCCRINDAGYRIVQRPDAFVHHKYAPSALRDEKRVIRDWYPLIKNRLYFGLRHASGFLHPNDIVEAALADKAFWKRDVAENVRRGSLTAADAQRFREQADAGIEAGLRLSTEEPRLLKAEAVGTHGGDFQPFVPASSNDARAVIYFDLAGEDGEVLARAREAAAGRQHVHAVVRRSGAPSVDFEDGTWIHDLGRNRESEGGEYAGVRAAIQRIISRRRVDRAYCHASRRTALKDIFTSIGEA